MSRLRTLMDAHALARHAEDIGIQLSPLRDDIGVHFTRHAHRNVAGGLYDEALLALDDAATALAEVTTKLNAAYAALHQEGNND